MLFYELLLSILKQMENPNGYTRLVIKIGYLDFTNNWHYCKIAAYQFSTL